MHDEATILPGPIRQNGYIVRDLDDAIGAWLALGVGPWIKLPPNAHAMRYRDVETSPQLAIAFANSGDLQIELIQPTDSEPSIYREFLDGGREGFHHLAWWADDYDSVERAAAAAGWELVTSGNSGGIARFCYFERDPRVSTVVEVMELNAATGWLMQHVRTAADEWDGGDPVRTLG